MISVLLLGFDSSARRAVEPGHLVPTLASLVPACVEGLVRDLCLVGPPAGRALADVADHAGCAWLEEASFAAAVRNGARQLRCSHVLVAQAGMVFGRPVLDELASMGSTMISNRPSFLLIRAERRDYVGRLFPVLAAPAALLAPREWLETADSPRLDVLVKRAKPLRVLQAVAWPPITA